MSSAPNQLALSALDSHLLSVLFCRHMDYVALAREEHLSPETLLAWTKAPAIAELIADLRELHSLSRDAADDRARRVGIDELVHVAQNTTDLVEKRRAASDLLRRLTTPTRNPRRTVPHPPPTGELPRSGGAAAEGAPSLPSLPTLRQPATPAPQPAATSLTPDDPPKPPPSRPHTKPAQLAGRSGRAADPTIQLEQADVDEALRSLPPEERASLSLFFGPQGPTVADLRRFRAGKFPTSPADLIPRAP